MTTGGEDNGLPSSKRAAAQAGCPGDAFLSCRQLLVQAGLEKTAWGLSIVEAEKRGGFTEVDRRGVGSLWPFDEQFADAVLSDGIGAATVRLIDLEKGMADQALASYRGKFEKKPKK